MKKLLLLFTLLLSISASVVAQDTLWVKQKEGKPYLLHKVKNGETLFLLAKKYAVPPAILADLNQVNYQDGLPTGSKFRIPIDNYNFIRIESVVKSKPIFFRVGEEDDLRSISRMFNVAQSAIQRWNNLISPDIETDKILQVGWIAFDSMQTPFAQNIPVINSASKTAPLPKPGIVRKISDTPADKNIRISDTDSAAIPSAFEELYYQQTTGTSITEESGAAVFYPLKTKAGPGVYYAFHNTAIRGSILKIMNPANGKIIYAKVIGTLPKLKEYHNAIVGLSSNAISAVGARDQRMFCKLKYR
jgi:LysM repeat protein